MMGTRHTHTLTDAQRLAWLRLARSENVGPITFRELLTRYSDPETALDALPDLARRGGRRRVLRVPRPEDIEAEIEAHDQLGARLIASCEPDFPAPLAAIADVPPVLSIRGDAGLLSRPAVAIVGARNASALGRQFADRLARDLGEQGFAVISGLARGIDGAAHQGALETGTAAVLAGGIEYVYPPEHEDLQEQIARDGVLVAEMPLGFRPQAKHFPRRNRLVSGLSLGVVVIEAAERSGSLITARFALEQGREVFAVPGSPLDPRCRGANLLIRDGATLVQRAADVTDVLAPLVERGLSEPDTLPLFEALRTDPDEDALTEARTALRPLLSATPTPADMLIRTAGLAPAHCLTVLLEWEIAGVVVRDGTGGVMLADFDALDQDSPSVS